MLGILSILELRTFYIVYLGCFVAIYALHTVRRAIHFINTLTYWSNVNMKRHARCIVQKVYFTFISYTFVLALFTVYIVFLDALGDLTVSGLHAPYMHYGTMVRRVIECTQCRIFLVSSSSHLQWLILLNYLEWCAICIG